MRCIEEEMLSAYANNELSPVDRELVDAHLVKCADCREKLAGYQEVRQRLETLRAEPTAPDITNTIMSRIKGHVSPAKPANRWKRRLFVLVPVSVILITVLIIQPWTFLTNPQNIIAQAYSSISAVQSYRFSLITGSNGKDDTVNYTVEFTAPDRYHLVQTVAGVSQEFIFIGDQEYYKGDSMSFLTMQSLTNTFSSMITREATLKWLDTLGDIQQLPDETIEGTACFHDQGRIDVEKQLHSQQEDIIKSGLPPISGADLQKMRDDLQALHDSMKFDLWIGKSDHIIHQLRIDTEEQNDQGSLNSYSIYKFYDFNQSITVEAPLDSNGKLLSGWFSTSPVQPAFSKNVQTSIDNNDPSNRMINYSVNVRNISADTLTGVNIVTNFSYIEGLWTRWDGGLSTPAPWTLAPGQSMEFVITFGYNAAVVPPDKIAEAVKNSVFYVGYIDPDGRQKDETVHFEVPAPIYTLPTNTLTTRALTPVGEYRINEMGGSSAQGDVIGNIGNEKYLFVLVNTQNSASPAEPGILILNIQNPAKPRKVSYLESPEGAGYMMNAALSGTTVYISTGTFLWIVDVSNPAAPRELARLAGTYPTLVTAGNYVYVNDQNSRISVVDISDPAHPQVKGSLELASLSGITLDISGNYLLAWAGNSLYTIDISSPSSLNIVNIYVFSFPENIEGISPSSAATPTYVIGHDVNANYAYVVVVNEEKTGISIMDISIPNHPRGVAFHILTDRRLSGTLFASENRIYAFAEAESGLDMRLKLAIIDISDPTYPKELEFDSLPDYWSFFTGVQNNSTQTYSLIGKYLYWYIGASPNQPVIEIFDLSSP